MDQENRKRIDQIRRIWDLRETEDLLEIWQHENPQDWQEEFFVAIQEILLERLGSLPAQPLGLSQPPGSSQSSLAQIFARIDDFLARSEWHAALEEVQQAIRLAPESAIAYNYRAVIYDVLEQPEKALADYRQAIRLDPAFQEARENLESLEGDLEEDFLHSEAVRYLDQALDYAENEEFELALEMCDLAQPELPPIAPAYAYQGLALQGAGEFVRAAAAYQEALRLNPRLDIARENLDQVNLRLEQEELGSAELQDPAEASVVETLSWGSDLALDELEETPGWLYLDETALTLTGWPGHRTRPGRSGYDPLENDFEAAHMQGVILRSLLERKFRTRQPVYWSVMAALGLLFCLPWLFGSIALLSGDLYTFASILVYGSFYPFIGLALLLNAFLSLRSSPSESEEGSSPVFY